MLASIPASILNQTLDDLGIPNRFKNSGSRSNNAAFPLTVEQTCIVHLIRRSMVFASWKDRRILADEMRAIYRAKDAETANTALVAFDAGHGAKNIRPSRRVGGAIGSRHPVLRRLRRREVDHLYHKRH